MVVSPLAKQLRCLCARLSLTDVEVAALSSISISTVRTVRRDGRPPSRGPTLRQLAAFIARAESAIDRASLGLP
jgi:hypothetical protein